MERQNSVLQSELALVHLKQQSQNITEYQISLQFFTEVTFHAKVTSQRVEKGKTQNG